MQATKAAVHFAFFRYFASKQDELCVRSAKAQHYQETDQEPRCLSRILTSSVFNFRKLGALPFLELSQRRIRGEFGILSQQRYRCLAYDRRFGQRKSRSKREESVSDFNMTRRP